MASSRRDDRSGLLDIHALSSVIDAQRRGGATAASVALPTFGTPWALQEVRAPAPAASRVAPASPAVAGPDHRPLYVMIAALSLAVASLGAYVLLRPPPTVVVERTAAVGGPEAPEPDHEAAAVAPEPEPEPEAAAEPAEATPTPEATPAVEASPTRPRTVKVPRTNPSPTPKPTPKVVPPKDDGVISVECVIDPSKCGKGGKTPPRTNDDPPASSKDLPATPSSAHIRDAMAPVKPQAKACASRHGGRAGEKVRVKLSVTGATGKITSAQALDDHAGTPLGKCVADALGKATLPKFAKPQAGVLYAVTL